MFHRHWTKNLKATPHGWISGIPSTSLAHRIPINRPPVLPTRNTSETSQDDNGSLRSPTPFLSPRTGPPHNQGPDPQHIMVPELSYCTTMPHHNHPHTSIIWLGHGGTATNQMKDFYGVKVIPGYLMDLRSFGPCITISCLICQWY